MKTLFSMAALGLTCFLLMGNTGCQSATHVQTGMGVYTGLTPPAVTSTGEWVHTGGAGGNAHWAFLAAASGAVASAALAESLRGKFVMEHTSGNVTHVTWVNNPCSNRLRNYLLSEWNSPFKRDRRLRLDCAGMQNILRHSHGGGRMKDVYNCIAKILHNGAHQFDPVSKLWMVFLNSGKVYIHQDGAVTDAYPMDGSWKACAKA